MLSFFEGIRLDGRSFLSVSEMLIKNGYFRKLFSIEWFQNLFLLRYGFLLLNITFLQVMANCIVYH